MIEKDKNCLRKTSVPSERVVLVGHFLRMKCMHVLLTPICNKINFKSANLQMLGMLFSLMTFHLNVEKSKFPECFSTLGVCL